MPGISPRLGHDEGSNPSATTNRGDSKVKKYTVVYQSYDEVHQEVIEVMDGESISKAFERQIYWNSSCIVYVFKGEPEQVDWREW